MSKSWSICLFVCLHNTVMLLTDQDRTYEKNPQHLGAFKLQIKVIHKNAVFSFLHFFLSHSSGTFSSELLTSVAERCLLPGSSTLISSSRRNIPYTYCPDRKKIMEVKKVFPNSYKASLLKSLAK